MKSEKTLEPQKPPLIINSIALALLLLSCSGFYFSLVQGYFQARDDATLYYLIIFSVIGLVFIGLPILGAIFSWKGYKKTGYWLGGLAIFNLVQVVIFWLAFRGVGLITD